MNTIATYTYFALAILFSFGLCQKLKAQDPAFSQFYVNPSYLNPAMTAQNATFRSAVNYRMRRLNSEANFKTFLSSLEYQIPNSNSGLGVQFFSDDQGNGQLRDQRVSLLYSYSVKINRYWSISAGLQAMAIERSIDPKRLVFEDQLADGQVIGATSERLNELDQNDYNLSSGLFVQGKQFYGGFAIHHLNQRDRANEFDSFLMNSSRKYTAHAGYKIHGNSKYVSFTPNVIYQQQGGHQQLNIGNYLQIDYFTAGVWYSWNRAAIFILGFQSDNFSVGYSIDLNTNTLYNGTSHEVSLSFSIENRGTNAKNKIYSTNCPSF